MAINVRLDRIFPGMGIGVRNDASYQNLGAAITSGSATTVPATGTLATPTTCGRIRIKIYNGAGTSPTFVSLKITASDGTNTVTFFPLQTPSTAITLSATSWVDIVTDYVLDTAASGAGGGATGQLSGTVGGATSFSITPVLGGTSPAATMDIEIVPLT